MHQQYTGRTPNGGRGSITEKGEFARDRKAGLSWTLRRRKQSSACLPDDPVVREASVQRNHDPMYGRR